MRISFLILVIVPIFTLAQIPYGNNPAAGHYCNTRGVKLYYEVYGHGEPLLLAHGNGGSIASVKDIIPFFAQYYKVIAVDTQAHGKSVDPADSLSFEMIADDFSALLDSLHTGPAYFIGWSDGGIDGVGIAMRHPEKLKKMAITGTNIFVDSTALPADIIRDMEADTRKMHARSNLPAKEKAELKYNDLDLALDRAALGARNADRAPGRIRKECPYVFSKQIAGPGRLYLTFFQLPNRFCNISDRIKHSHMDTARRRFLTSTTKLAAAAGLASIVPAPLWAG